MSILRAFQSIEAEVALLTRGLLRVRRLYLLSRKEQAKREILGRAGSDSQLKIRQTVRHS